jgi:hypothetical protein
MKQNLSAHQAAFLRISCPSLLSPLSRRHGAANTHARMNITWFEAPAVQFKMASLLIGEKQPSALFVTAGSGQVGLRCAMHLYIGVCHHGTRTFRLLPRGDRHTSPSKICAHPYNQSSRTAQCRMQISYRN